MPSESLDQLLDRLYALPPDEFVTARDEAVTAAREAGDRSGALAIGKARKPTVAAWMVNLLVRRQPELVEELLDLAGSLRRAQRELHGPALRELSGKRREVIDTLVSHARTLAVQAGRRGALPLSDVANTLGAALADQEVAEQVRSGRLARAAGYAGFGEVVPSRPTLRVIDGGGGAAESPDRRTADAEEAQAALHRATAVEQDAEHALAEITAQLEDLRQRQATAESALREARTRRRAAERTARRYGRR